MRYPDTDEQDRVFECSPLDDRKRFTLEATLDRPGGYLIESFARWPGSRWQRPLTSYTGAVEVLPGVANRPPMAAGMLADQTVPVGGVADVDVGGAFRDPNGDPLTYEATSSAPAVASVEVSGSTVTVRALAAGTATVTVTATDPGGLRATQSFTVTVLPGGASSTFTDHPLRPGVTPVRAVHFTELRQRIDALRAAQGLGRFRWTDPVLRAGVTPVRLVHLTELRSALEAAYRAAGRPAPRWTDPVPVRGRTPIRAAHLTELRAAVVALE